MFYCINQDPGIKQNSNQKSSLRKHLTKWQLTIMKACSWKSQQNSEVSRSYQQPERGKGTNMCCWGPVIAQGICNFKSTLGNVMLKLGGSQEIFVALVFLLLSALLPMSFTGRTNPKSHWKWGKNGAICADKQPKNVYIMLLSGQIYY